MATYCTLLKHTLQGTLFEGGQNHPLTYTPSLLPSSDSNVFISVKY